jgi:outer membrane protein with beta-barrel domain
MPMFRSLVVLGVLAAGTACAQTWEVGAIGGWAYSPHLTVKSGSASADTGLNNGGMYGVFGGEDTYNHLSGEARYLYRNSDLKLSSGGTTVHFGGHTHYVGGEFLLHLRPREATTRPFILFGGGISIIQGTGTESAGQPLGRFAALTATREILPTADVGVGVKFKLRDHMRFRVEFDDFISPSPSKVIAPAPGASISGWMHDLAGLTAISFTW